jgi:hypothetical protein
MILTVAAVWLGLSVPVAAVVAALGRSGRREDEVRGLLSTLSPTDQESTPRTPSSSTNR